MTDADRVAADIRSALELCRRAFARVDSPSGVEFIVDAESEGDFRFHVLARPSGAAEISAEPYGAACESAAAAGWYRPFDEFADWQIQGASELRRLLSAPSRIRRRTAWLSQSWDLDVLEEGAWHGYYGHASLRINAFSLGRATTLVAYSGAAARAHSVSLGVGPAISPRSSGRS